MTQYQRGLYERLITRIADRNLAELGAKKVPSLEDLRDADAGDRLALHIAQIIERTIDSLPQEKRAVVGAGIANSLLLALSGSDKLGDPDYEALVEPPKVLRAIRALVFDGTHEQIREPLIPLLDTTLLTNAPGEPNVGSQIQAEIDSADRIDLLMAFIRRSGLRPLRDALRKHIEADKDVRVLTTVYTGSTECDALEMLQDLGAKVRVSYDTTGTRLHAKAWLFHRESGFSTAYIGSSNLTHSAQVSGLEWNVRVSQARNRAVIEKLLAVFESYWQQADFEPFDRSRFEDAVNHERTFTHSTLPPTEIRLEPFQERLLEQISLAREDGRSRNLLVSATGTGKTVMAAVDYARLRTQLPRARLLFVAHREEILNQARSTFAHALRDPSFGELWVGSEKPSQWEHVFASIQSLNANSLVHIDPSYFDVVIVDEFHHVAADSYERILQRLKPRQLLGLTATPERSDGMPILQWFDNQITAELRLWDAIDQHRLVPFTYFGIADSLDLSDIPWVRGRGYDTSAVSNLITSTDVWAKQVLKQCTDYLGTLSAVRALGFCVSVDHAHYMARIFSEYGVSARAIDGTTPIYDRRSALRDLEKGVVSFVFSVDLFNEGVDVPSVDTLLMLRPTDSPVLFVQQLGRGLRKAPGKSCCVVLDFIGQHRREFRFDRRLSTLVGGTRKQIQEQVRNGFPFLPAGCQMQLDRVASERVLANIRQSLPARQSEQVDELRRLALQHPGISLLQYLEATGLELEDVYRKSTWTDLKRMAGLPTFAIGPENHIVKKAIARLLHVDDRERLDVWRNWLVDPSRFNLLERSRSTSLIRMLLAQMLESVPGNGITVLQGADLLLAHRSICGEIVELCDVLVRRIGHHSIPLDGYPETPLRTHARYSRREILAACDEGNILEKRMWNEGVLFVKHMNVDLLKFTLDKTSGQFSPTTRYRDYAVSRDLIHWESQKITRANTVTGRRYQNHAHEGSRIWLFARPTADERAYTFLGPATYVSHTGERPMAIIWRLERSLPGDLFQAFAAAVA